MPNTITYLGALSGHSTTKTFTRLPDDTIAVQQYDSGTWFSHSTHDVENIRDLSDFLFMLQDFDHAMVIRGQIKPEYANKKRVTRTIYDLPDSGQVGMFQDWPDGLNWIMLDFDKVPLPAGMTIRDGVEMLVQTLPVEFRDASFHYQLSSSSGVGGWSHISAHVFFWLHNAWPNAQIVQWAKNLNATAGKRIFDPAPLHTVQPNYTARPSFVNMADPVDHRSGFVAKSRDDVDLVWIDPPAKYVEVNGTSHKVGTVIAVNGAQHIVTPSLADRIAAIGAGGEYREPLKSAVSYYFWYNGRESDPAEIKRLLHEAFPGGLPGGRPYLDKRPLDALVRWFATRATHDPVNPRKRLDDALAARLVAMKANRPPLPDNDNEYSDWVLETRQINVKPVYYVDGECGKGKTEWMLRRIGNQPGRYIIALPRIELIVDFQRRFFDLFPDACQTKGYIVETIYSDKTNDVRDAEEGGDDHASDTVPAQVKKFGERIGEQPHVLLFITHAALHLSRWWEWSDFHLMVDEIFDPFLAYTRDFTRTFAHTQQFVAVGGVEETNYYPLELTHEGRERIENDAFDDNEPALRALMEAIRLPNSETYVRKTSWDNISATKLSLIRLTNADMLEPFRSVTIMGDEFTYSMLAIGFEYRFGLEFQCHPDWHSTRTRKTPLAERANIFFFASKNQRRGSLAYFDSDEIIPKLVSHVAGQHKGQTLMTTNIKYKKQFETAKTLLIDAPFIDGVARLERKSFPQILWVEPKKSGTNAYMPLCNVAFFAAMRPAGDEIASMSRALGITEEEIIRWREYNTLYQFIMRCNLRDYDSDQECNVYVFDEWQAEYLRERFGGCKTFKHVTGVIEPAPAKKGGRPSKGMTAAERKRQNVARKKAEAAALKTDASLPIDPEKRLDELIRRKRDK